jgi:hypothetical protein
MNISEYNIITIIVINYENMIFIVISVFIEKNELKYNHSFSFFESVNGGLLKS